MQQRQHGFTLIELLCVTGIIGLLALFAYPSYQGHVRKAKRTEAWAALVQTMQQQERYFSQHNRYRAYHDAASAGSFKWFSGATAASSAYHISAAACAGSDVQDCIVLSATPNAGTDDSRCGTLTLDSRGEKSAAGLPTDDAPAACR